MSLLRTLILLTALGGCVGSPGPAPEVSPALVIPAAWSAPATEGEVVPGRWWRSFGGPELDELVGEALTYNRDLVASAARLRRATAGARAAGAAHLPTVDLGGGGQRRRQNFIGFPIPGADGVLSTTTTTYDVSASVAWELDLWDRLGASERAAVADQWAAEADLEAARQSIAAATVRAWLAVVEGAGQASLAEATHAAWRVNEEAVVGRFEAGVASALDLRLVRTNLASAAASAAAAEQRVAEARRQLELVLGRYPSGEQAARFDLDQDPGPAPAGLPAELLVRRPDLVAAQRRFEAARERAGAARADLYPRISLTGDVGRTSGEVEDILDGDFSVWGLAARLAMPLFDGGRREAAIEGADAATEEAAALVATAFLRAASEVERSLDAEEYIRAQDQALTRARREARAGTDLALEQYRSGLVDLVTLLETQRRQYAVESQRLTARYALLASRVDLHLALGGGFGGER